MSDDSYKWNQQRDAEVRARANADAWAAVNKTGPSGLPSYASSPSFPSASSSSSSSYSGGQSSSSPRSYAGPSNRSARTGTAGRGATQGPADVSSGTASYQRTSPTRPPLVEPAAALRFLWLFLRIPFWLPFLYLRRLWRRPILLVKDMAILAVIGLICFRVYDVGSRPRPAWVEKQYQTPSGKFAAFVGALFTSPLFDPKRP